MSTRVFLVEGLLVVGLAAMGLFEGLKINQNESVLSEPVGPGWYIISLSAMLLICGVFSMYSWFRESKRACKSLEEGVKGAERISLSHYAGPAVIGTLALVAYTVMLPIVGYLVSTMLFFVFSLRIFGEKPWLRCIVIGILLGLAFYCGFVVLGQVQMP